MEPTIIWETIKSTFILAIIFESEPFIKISNKLLFKFRFPRWVNHLLECNLCLAFWFSLIPSFLLQTTTPTFISIITIILFNKLNEKK